MSEKAYFVAIHGSGIGYCGNHIVNGDLLYIQ